MMIMLNANFLFFCVEDTNQTLSPPYMTSGKRDAGADTPFVFSESASKTLDSRSVSLLNETNNTCLSATLANDVNGNALVTTDCEQKSGALFYRNSESCCRGLMYGTPTLSYLSI